MAKKKATGQSPRESRLKRFAKTIGKIGDLVRGRSYSKLSDKTQISPDRLKAIKGGRVEPDRGEINKLARFDWEKEKAKDAAKKKKEAEQRKKQHPASARISPEQLHEYVGFPAGAIRQRMQPAFNFSENLAKKTAIKQLYRSKGKYVTGTRKNRQEMYYYVTIDIAQDNNQPDSFGHNFMVKENAEQMIAEEGDVIHTIYQDDDGKTYTEKIIIFNVLTFPQLKQSYDKKKLQSWEHVPPAIIKQR